MVIRTLAIAFAFAAGTVSAQSYPTKPIRIITAGVGGGNDLITRIIVAGIQGPLGQPFVVDNRSGGIIMGEMIAKAPPDGYTLMLMGAGVWLAPFLFSNVPFDPVKDFASITIADRAPVVVVVHPSVPANSIKELIALAKAKPGSLNWSSGNNGSPGHLAGELFQSVSGIKIQRIAYKSGNQETADLLAGRVQMAFSPAGSTMPHVKAGKLRALAIASHTPSTLTPGVPTAIETGLRGFEIGSTHAVFAPAGTPVPIINRLNQEMVRFLRLPETAKSLAAYSVEPVGSTPEELSVFVKGEMARLGKLIKDLGIQPQ